MALVLIYDAMHFIQQQLKLLESGMSCQLWLNSRNKMMNDMTKAQRAVLGDCFNLEPFVEIMAFLIVKISPKMTFLKDTSTDYQVFTRPRTAEELRFNNESRMIESRLPVRGENLDRESDRQLQCHLQEMIIVTWRHLIRLAHLILGQCPDRKEYSIPPLL